MGIQFNAGFEKAMVWYYDATTGAAIGQSSTLANGSASGAYVLQYVNTADIAPEDQTVVDFEGGDKVFAKMTFGTSRLNPFTITYPATDTTLIAMMNGGAVNTANTAFTKYSLNPNRVTPQSIGLALLQRGQSTTGGTVYRVLIIPKAEVKFVAGGYTYRGRTDNVINVSTVNSLRAHTGQTFGTGANNLAFSVEENTVDHYYFESDAPIHIYTHRRTDANAASPTLPYLPLSSTVTLNASGNELVAAGVPTALTSASTSTGAVQIPAGGSAGDYCVITYKTNFVPS